jgi:hypothetical protein
LCGPSIHFSWTTLRRQVIAEVVAFAIAIVARARAVHPVHSVLELARPPDWAHPNRFAPILDATAASDFLYGMDSSLLRQALKQ